MKQFLPLVLLFTYLLSPLPPPCLAQNVSGYGVMQEPLLYLLREPAVHKDLGLSREQIARLLEVNESFDGILLASRNMAPKEAQENVANVMSETRAHVAKLLSSEQQTRLSQIAYRLRGLSFVLAPQAASQLQLSDQQKERIRAIVEEA